MGTVEWVRENDKKDKKRQESHPSGHLRAKILKEFLIRGFPNHKDFIINSFLNIKKSFKDIRLIIKKNKDSEDFVQGDCIKIWHNF